MLQHRVPLEGADSCSWTSTESASLPQPAAVIPRVALRRAFAILAGYDVVCLALFLAMLGVAQASPHGVSRTLTYLAWCVGTGVLGAAAARTSGLFAKDPLVKGRNIPALALVSGTATLLPAVLVTVGWAAFTRQSLFAPALCGASAVLCLALGHLFWRLWLDLLLQRGCCLDRVIVLADTASEARVLSASVEQRTAGRLRAVASFAVLDAGQPACFAWIEQAVQLREVDQIIVSEGRDGRPADRGMVFRLVRAGADVTVLPRLGPAYRVSDKATLTADLPSMSGPMPAFGGFGAGIKRSIDLVGAVTAAIVASPVFLIIAVAIKLNSPGPVFFRQTRHGVDGQVFRIWKFRTMFIDASASTSMLQTRRGDPRVTAVGRFLRRTSLDELPQLFNVIRGDMSIVGPRPHAVGMLIAGKCPDQLLNEYGLRHRVKPGITGWAQVHGSRGEIDSPRSLRRRFALDRHYIENWSVRMDVMIILRTMTLPFRDRHAF